MARKEKVKVGGCLAIPAENSSDQKENYVLDIGKYKIMMFEFLNGDVPRSGTRSMLSQIGENLARLNKIQSLQSFGVSLDDYQILYYNPLQEFLKSSEVNNHFANHPLVEEIRMQMPMILEILHMEGLQTGMIHSDVFWDNMIFDGETLVGIIDFECVCFGPILYELGVTILGCCYEGAELKFELVQALLNSYQQILPLTTKEKENLWKFVYFALIFYSFWRFNEFNIVLKNHSQANAYLDHWKRLINFKNNLDKFNSLSFDY